MPRLLALLLLAACPSVEDPGPDPEPTPQPTPEPTPAPPPEALTVEPAPPCAEPVAGFDRLVPEDLPLVLPGDDVPRSCQWMPGGVVASDLDGDGDHDLLFTRPGRFPYLLEQDGGWTSVEVPHDTVALFGREALAQAAVDLDGDGLPEVLLVGEGFAASCRNLGGLQFAEPELLYFDADYPIACINTLAVGDVDGDGDLDLVLPGLDPIPEEGWVNDEALPWPGTTDLLLLQDEGVFTVAAQLRPPDYPWLSMLGLFTDRDDDGDLDLFLGSDRARDGRPGATFWRNEAGELIDDAPEIGADVHHCVMGAASADFDGDGTLDYCFSDLNWHLACLTGGPEPGYVEAGQALGLAPDLDANPAWAGGTWSPFSVEAVDLDNDGDLDFAAAAGPPPGPGGIADSGFPPAQPDAIFERDGPFVDRSMDLGFGDPRPHYGLASADLDGDGSRELILGAFGGPARLWRNPCGAAAWTEIALVGPAGNRQGFGARVEVVTDRSQVRELHALRTVGQSAAELHFGLAASEAFDLQVRWPDGAVSAFSAVPARARVTVRHPAAPE